VISRRSFLASSTAVLGAPFLNRGRFQLFADSPVEYSTRAVDLVRCSTVIDMLGLLTLDYRTVLTWQSMPADFGSADFQKLKNSGITIFHPAVGFIGPEVYEESLADVEGWNDFIAGRSNEFLRIENPGDLSRAKVQGKIGIVIGLQNSAHFRTLEDVDRFYRLGQRVSQLTYFDNRLGGGSTDPRDGLSAYGAEIVARMNTLGMAIDVSHCSDRTTLDAFAASRKPVLITHSNCRALVPTSARCETDEAIRRMAATGGVMGVTMVRFFVRSHGPATINDVLDHIDHVAKLVGVEHVGVGTDVDLRGRDHGHVTRRSDLDGVDYSRKIYDLAEGLIRRNYSAANIELILGKNFERALAAIWTV
jgi:membrane dipeptidase